MKQVLNKQVAFDYFLNRLVNSDTGELIAEVYLFGSVARGDADDYSDIDVLIFSANGVKKVREMCADISFETALKYGESVEPLVYTISRLRYRDSNFISSVVERGRRVYKMTEERLTRKEAENYLDLGMDYLEQARNSIERSDLRLGIDGAYNACELVVKGLLILEMGSLPRTHGGIVQKFGQMYVKEGKLAESLGRGLRLALDARNRARYDFGAQVSTEEAMRVTDMAASLIKTLKAKLST